MRNFIFGMFVAIVLFIGYNLMDGAVKFNLSLQMHNSVSQIAMLDK